MPRYIDAEKLCDLARNHVDCAVTPNDIMRFPAADVQEVRHGHWKLANAHEAFGGDEECWDAHGNPVVSIYCSVCNFEPYVGDVVAIPPEAIEAIVEYALCPKCGAKMDEEEK